jgi:hypothetical protein
MRKYIFILIGLAIILLVLFILFLPKSDSIKTADLSPIKTFGGLDVSDEAILNSPSDMVISPDGKIIVSDSRENKIVVFDADGKVINQFGREGKGPGDLQRPRYIKLEGDTLKVFESGNDRIQYFSLGGQYLNMIPLKFSVGIGSFIFGANDDVFFATNGFRTEDLIYHYRTDGEKLNPIGRIEGNSFQIYEMLEMQDALIKKEVPDSLRNLIILFQSSEGALYAFYQALPLIKIYSPEGELKKAVRLDLPEFEKIIDRCSKLNMEGKQKGSPGVWSLRFWRDGVITDKGDLILLISDPEKMILYKFNKEGKLVQQFRCVDDNISMMAANGPYLWAYGGDTQVFYQFKLE